MQIFSCQIVGRFTECQMLGPSSCSVTSKEAFQCSAPDIVLLHIAVKHQLTSYHHVERLLEQLRLWCGGTEKKDPKHGLGPQATSWL